MKAFLLWMSHSFRRRAEGVFGKNDVARLVVRGTRTAAKLGPPQSNRLTEAVQSVLP